MADKPDDLDIPKMLARTSGQSNVPARIADVARPSGGAERTSQGRRCCSEQSQRTPQHDRRPGDIPVW
jgi:hypothetical protein